MRYVMWGFLVYTIGLACYNAYDSAWGLVAFNIFMIGLYAGMLYQTRDKTKYTTTSVRTTSSWHPSLKPFWMFYYMWVKPTPRNKSEQIVCFARLNNLPYTDLKLNKGDRRV